MADNRIELAEGRIRGRIVHKPELTRTMDAENGTHVCRITVEKQTGRASRPVRMALYAKGEFAKRCGLGLHQGDLIEGWGEVGPFRIGVGHQEIIVADGDIKLREMGPRATA